MTAKPDLIWQSPNFGSKDKQYPDDKTFQILALQGEQHISACGKYTLQVTARQENLKFEDFLGKSATFTLLVGSKHLTERNFTGIITGFTKADTCFGNQEQVAGVDRHYNYRIEIQPKLWLLTQKYDSRVFSYGNEEDLFKVLDIIFKEHGIKYSLKRADKEEEKKPGQPNKSPAKEPPKGPPRDYHESYYYVQYRETDFDFVSRLMEEAGIWYYFNHEDDTLILCDEMSKVPWVGPHREVTYSEDKSIYGKVGHEETLFDFYFQRDVGPNHFFINDYNYEKSKTNYLNNKTTPKPKQIPELTHYEHTREFANKPGTKSEPMRKTGEMLLQNMLEEAVTGNQVAQARSTSRSLQAGYKFTLEKHFNDEYNQTWLITSLTMSVRQGDYSVLLAGVPMANAYRPPRKTPTPVIASQQTATVVGRPGSEVYTDHLGRCKLRFHWDKYSDNDDKASMWVRVANNYAGQNYGVQWIPRVGQEVLVSFIDGNPSHPVVNGRVYNDINKPPLNNATKYQNIIKTIKDNHILFDDRDGAELLNLRAQRDMNTLVVNNQSLSIGANQSVSVGGNTQTWIGGSSVRTVTQNETIEVEKGDRSVRVKKGDYITKVESGCMVTEVTGSAVSIYRDGEQTSVLGCDRYLDVHKNDRVWVGGDALLTVEGDYSVSVKNNMVVKSKKYTCKAETELVMDGKKVQVNAKNKLVLQCGTSSITLEKNKISIQAISIESTCVGIHKVVGGMVLIN